MHLNELFLEKDQCPQWGLNSRPLVYKTSALPLSCRGDRVKKPDPFEKLLASSDAGAKNLVPIFQTKRVQVPAVGRLLYSGSVESFGSSFSSKLPPVRIELTTAGLRDQRSTSEL